MSGSNPGEELARLLERLEREDLTAEEKDRLNQLLLEDDEALDHYVRDRRTDAMLAWRFAPFAKLEPAADAFPGTLPSPATRREPSARGGPLRRRSSWIALATLFAGVAVGVVLDRGLVRRAANGVAIQSREQAPVATLTSVGPDVRWGGAAGDAMAVGTELNKGWIHLAAGTVELTFRSGATVRLDGPALFAIDSPLRGFLSYGNVRVHAPESARDFAVGTASMEVVDLGTEFDLSVDQQSGSAEIGVREGLVDLHLANTGGANRIQSLAAGESAAVDPSGRLTAIQGGKREPLLLAHWPLDDDAETPLVQDASPNQRHGKLNRPTHERTRAGRIGRALALGTDGFVDFSPHLAALTGAKAFTLAAWVRNADNIVFSTSDGTARERVQFELYGPWLYYGWQQGNAFDRISAGVSGWERDRWYHVAVSVSGGNVTIYRDGRALMEPKRTGGVLNTRALAPCDLKNPSVAFLGRVPSNHVQRQQFLGGDLDDVQLYGRALDEVAIRYLFEHPGETLSPEPGL